MLKKPQNVYMPIDKFQAKIFKHKDAEKRGEWVANFALALSEEAEDDFAKLLLDHAQLAWYKDTVKAWRSKAKKALSQCGKEPTAKQIHAWCYEEYGDEYLEAIELLSKNKEKLRKKTQEFIGEINDILPTTGNDQTDGDNPQDAPNGNAGVDSKSATSCNQFTADVDTREGSQSKYEVSAITRNETRSTYDLDTSANHCGPRQAKNGGASHREAEDESANASNPFALDMPSKVNAKTRDSLGRGRYQPPSLGPEDGNLYDQVPDKVSTDEKRTGGHSPLSKSPSSRPPVRQSEPDVMSLAYAGEFGNVRLTQEQYAQLGIKFGNQQKLNRAIDSLSCLIENGEKNPQNHYAELLKWVSYRDDMEEKEELRASSAPHYETVSEHNARIVRESDAWIHEYCQQQKKNRKAANG